MAVEALASRSYRRVVPGSAYRAAIWTSRRSTPAIAATHRTGYIMLPASRWDMLNKAVVTIECEAHEPSVAAETVRSIIRQNAELVAHIGVREIEITSISPVS